MYFGLIRCNVCKLAVSGCVCIAALTHPGEHPEVRQMKWPTPDRTVMAVSSTAVGTPSLGFLRDWVARKPPSN